MVEKLSLLLRKHLLALLMLLWLSLNFLPWTTWLESNAWLRLGISFMILVAPGIIVSSLLMGKRLTLISHSISGLAISVLLVGSLGLIGRILHLPFSYIKPEFVLIGTIIFLVAIRYAYLGYEFYKPKQYSLSVVVLFFAVSAASLALSIGHSFGGDNFSYLAYLTSWQHANPLNFQEVISNTGGLDNIRFWFAMFPMVQAFLAETSKMHGLFLLGLYLEPFLIIFSLLAFYNLLEDLLSSDFYALIALLFHIIILFTLYGSRQAGSTFFSQITEDKVFAAFVLAPIFFLAIRCLLESFTFKTLLFALLTGLAMALTHPIILAFCIIIAGLYAGFATLIYKDYKKFGLVVLILFITILPSSSLRFVGVPWVSKYIFGANSTLRQPGGFDLESAYDLIDTPTIISSIKNTPFYGFNLERVQILEINKESLWQNFFSRSYLWILGISFIWSLFNLKKKTVAPFLAATSLFVLLCAIPYTGWLVGSLVSIRMLWRAPWMFSAGIAAAILINEFFEFILKRSQLSSPHQFSSKWSTLAVGLLIGLLVFISFAGNSYYSGQWKRLTQLEDTHNDLQAFVDLGDYLENNINPASIFVAPMFSSGTWLSDYLPGISSKSKVAFFRTQAFSPSVSLQKLNIIFSLDKQFTLKDRINVMQKYHIQYILTPTEKLKNYYLQDAQFSITQKVGNLWILKFLPTTGF